jgi:diaminopimelate epimerase
MDMSMTGLPFSKWQGLGNDFVVVDSRSAPQPITPDLVRQMSNRRTGVGCDQFIVLEPSGKADLFMRIYNADGSESGACGNATRCIARLVMTETGQSATTIETRAGLLEGQAATDGLVTVNMGKARLDWQEIPLALACDTTEIDYQKGPFSSPCAVNMGNPHAVFFVPDLDDAAIRLWGPQIETDPFFPERTNVGFAKIESRTQIRLKVWERGAGLTEACGSGACAALVASVRRGFTDRTAKIQMDGGALTISWAETGHVLMTGPASQVFTGMWRF